MCNEKPCAKCDAFKKNPPRIPFEDDKPVGKVDAKAPKIPWETLIGSALGGVVNMYGYFLLTSDKVAADSPLKDPATVATAQLTVGFLTMLYGSDEFAQSAGVTIAAGSIATYGRSLGIGQQPQQGRISEREWRRLQRKSRMSMGSVQRNTIENARTSKKVKIKII